MDLETEFKSKATVSKRITVPMLVWEKWERDCMLNFNNTYYSKMQFDHEFRESFNSITSLLVNDLMELKEEVQLLRTELENLKHSDETPKLKTFGAKK